MPLRFPGLPHGAWVRVCQECNHPQATNPPAPNKDLSDTYRNRACRKCKSEALDFGQTNLPVEEDE